jgi:hypothetical protein
MVDVRHDKTAQHEEQVDGQIALAHKMGMLIDIQAGKILEHEVKDDHPQGGDAAQRRPASRGAPWTLMAFPGPNPLLFRSLNRESDTSVVAETACLSNQGCWQCLLGH